MITSIELCTSIIVTWRGLGDISFSRFWMWVEWAFTLRVLSDNVSSTVFAGICRFRITQSTHVGLYSMCVSENSVYSLSLALSRSPWGQQFSITSVLHASEMPYWLATGIWFWIFVNHSFFCSFLSVVVAAKLLSVIRCQSKTKTDMKSWCNMCFFLGRRVSANSGARPGYDSLFSAIDVLSPLAKKILLLLLEKIL